MSAVKYANEMKMPLFDLFFPFMCTLCLCMHWHDSSTAISLFTPFAWLSCFSGDFVVDDGAIVNNYISFRLKTTDDSSRHCKRVAVAFGFLAILSSSVWSFSAHDGIHDWIYSVQLFNCSNAIHKSISLLRMCAFATAFLHIVSLFF